MNNERRLRNYKRSITASTIDDFTALTRILKTHTRAGIFNSYDITSIIAVSTEKKCMNEGCNNIANFAISQRFESGKYYTYHLCKECLTKAYIVYADEFTHTRLEVGKPVTSTRNIGFSNVMQLLWYLKSTYSPESPIYQKAKKFFSEGE